MYVPSFSCLQVTRQHRYLTAGCCCQGQAECQHHSQGKERRPTHSKSEIMGGGGSVDIIMWEGGQSICVGGVSYHHLAVLGGVMTEV